jgi:gas vesicle protein
MTRSREVVRTPADATVFRHRLATQILECIMIIILGLIILVAAVVVGVVGVLSNGGGGHALTHPFSVFGYHVTGSTGTLFLYGIVVGAVAVAGLSLLLAAARRSSRRGSEARRSLKSSRRETAAVSQDRDELIGQRDKARAYTASSLGNGAAQSGGDVAPGRRHLFGRRPASGKVAGVPAQAGGSSADGEIPAGTSAPAE